MCVFTFTKQHEIIPRQLSVFNKCKGILYSSTNKCIVKCLNLVFLAINIFLIYNSVTLKEIKSCAGQNMSFRS